MYACVFMYGHTYLHEHMCIENGRSNSGVEIELFEILLFCGMGQFLVRLYLLSPGPLQGADRPAAFLCHPEFSDPS